MEEGQLARWLKKEGDKVSMGEPLAEIDTDKATMEMQALSNGVLLKILVNEGESAPLGEPIAIVGEKDEDISELLKRKKGKPPKTEEEKAEEKPEAKERKKEAEKEEQTEDEAAAEEVVGAGIGCDCNGVARLLNIERQSFIQLQFSHHDG